MKYAFLALTLLACAGDTDEPALIPHLEFVAPQDGETVAAGDVQVSLSVEHFAFTEPTFSTRFDPTLLLPVASAWAHGEGEHGEPAGFVQLRLDGVVVADLTSTQHTLTDVAAGPHTLDAALYYADGDDLGVTAAVTFTAE